MTLISKTFSIEQKIYEKFEQICDSKRINKSKVLQDAIKTFIGENYDIDKNIFYNLRHVSNSDLVQVESKDKDFIILSNGNKMNIFDFEMLYEEEDLVKKVLNYFGITEDVDQVDPEQLFDGVCSLNLDMLKNAFEKVDITKVKDSRESVHYREITNDDVIKDERTMEEKVAELKEKHMIEELRNKVQNGEWIKKLKQKQFLDSLGTLKIETAAEEFLNQSSINLEKFREILDTIETEKIDQSLDDKVAIERRTIKENGEEIPNTWNNGYYKVEDSKPLEGPIQEEQISFEETKHIVKNIIEKKEELNNANINELSTLLSSIYNTTVKIEENDNIFYIHIAKKYHYHIELNSIFQRFDNYEYVDIKEVNIIDKIRENISKINTSGFDTLQSKVTHMSEMLCKILKGVVTDGTLISVSFDEPLYKIIIPENCVCEELYNFVLSYGINEEYIIFEISDAKL